MKLLGALVLILTWLANYQCGWGRAPPRPFRAGLASSRKQKRLVGSRKLSILGAIKNALGINKEERALAARKAKLEQHIMSLGMKMKIVRGDVSYKLKDLQSKVGSITDDYANFDSKVDEALKMTLQRIMNAVYAVKAEKVKLFKKLRGLKSG